MKNTFDLEAKLHTSRVLGEYIQSRPGAQQRIADTVSNSQMVSTSVNSDGDALRSLFDPIAAASGFNVTDKTAMTVSTVYACLTKISGAVLQLPVVHYRHNAKGEREQVHNSPLWWLFNEQPHAQWTSASWKEWIVRCVALRGDQYTRILRSSNASGGQVKGLEPLHPDLVVPRVYKDGNSYRIVYDVVDMYSGRVDTVDQDDMLHFAGFGFNGVRSLSVIQHAAKQSIGNSLAAAEYTGRTIGEGAMPQIALKYDGKMNELQAEELRRSFVATYTGVGSRKLPLVLTNGGTVQQLSISPADLQLMEARKFEKEDICEAMGVPPIIVGISEKASSWGTGIEQIILGFVKFTINPMLCRWEEEINRKLFRNAGQFLEFELDGLLRGDSKAQSEVFKSALGGPGTGDGYMTVNEVRRLKNLPPKTGGDDLYKAQRGSDAAPTKNANDKETDNEDATETKDQEPLK